MKYLALIYQAPKALDNLTPEAYQEILDGHRSLQERTQADGSYLGANRLEMPDTATSIRFQDGKRLLTDGPFAETKEVLVGYYLFECDHLDAALERASLIPQQEGSVVEVRPVFAMPEMHHA